MSSLEQKISMLDSILKESPNNYAETFKTDIAFFFDEFSDYNPLLSFLENIENESAIRSWVNNLTSRIVMHEDDDLIEELIADYYYNG